MDGSLSTSRALTRGLIGRGVVVYTKKKLKMNTVYGNYSTTSQSATHGKMGGGGGTTMDSARVPEVR